MDSFAQTGALQDDLFTDFSNEESMQTRAQDDLFGDDFTPAVEEETISAPQQSSQQSSHQSFKPPSRGWGQRVRGGGRSWENGHTTFTPLPASSKTSEFGNITNPLGNSRHAPNPTNEPRHAAKLPPETSTEPEALSATAQHAEPPEDAPTEPRIAKAAAVRGDRSATGGTARTKLTDEELAAKISSIQLKNADLEAAHARAQADADSFAQRENEAAKRRQVERRDRQQLMGEREKNRLRKLKAQEGREWDSEKKEEDYSDRRRGYGRGAHGGVAGTRLGNDRPERTSNGDDDGREYIYRDGRGRGRGRGGRNHGDGIQSRQIANQQTPQNQDFPALDAKPQTSTENLPSVTSAPKLSFPSKGSEGTAHSNHKKETNGAASVHAQQPGSQGQQSWADMVEDGRS